MSNYINNEMTAYVVLNRKADAGRQANALGHLALGLPALLGDEAENLALEDYIDSQGKLLARVSRYPVTVLSAKNGSQIRNVRSQLEQAGLAVNAFVSEMVAVSSDAQRAAVRGAAEVELEYVALVSFGPKVVLEPVMKKFTLYRGQATNMSVGE